MHRSLIFVAACLFAALSAAQAGQRDSDRVFSQDELANLLTDHAVEFFSGGVSRFRGDGAYSFKYTDSDPPHLGSYEVLDKGQVCVQFLNGSTRCDTFVDDGTRMVLIIEDGTRFPVRDHRPLVDGY